MTRLTTNWNTYEYRKKLVLGFSDMVLSRLREGWSGYLLSFMFNPVAGSPRVVGEIMAAECERVYRTSLTRIVRNPYAPSQASRLPIWLVCPDYPVFKRAKMAKRDVALNDGLHFGGIALIPPWSRLEYGFGDHVINFKHLYVGGDSRLRTFAAIPIEKTPGKAVRYTFKAYENGRVTMDDLIIFPRARSEVVRRSGQAGETTEEVLRAET